MRELFEEVHPKKITASGVLDLNAVIELKESYLNGSIQISTGYGMFLFFNNGIINGWLDMLQENVIEWNGYVLRRVSESDVDFLVEISESAFGILLSREYYINKNLTSSLASSIWYIALDIENKPAAFYGVYACELVLDGKKVKAVQSGDTMTHKSHTGKGLFTKLAELTYDLCRRNGICFVFGFPNYKFLSRFCKKIRMGLSRET